VSLLFLGITSIIAIPKESTPEVKVPIAIVVTTLPGASASDVEKLVTNIIEKPLKNGLNNVNNLSSVSREGVSQITVEFDAKADLDTSLNDLRDQVDIAKPDLPSEAEDPRIIKIDFAAEPVVTFSIAANVPEPILFDLGKEVENELEIISGVSSVSISGLRDREVQVLLDRSLLTQFGLTAQQIAQAISSANASAPAGSIEIDGVEYPVRFEGDIVSASNVALIPITAQTGAPIFVGDIAEVVDGYSDATSLARTSVDGNPSTQSLSFNVFKATNANITEISRSVVDRLDELQEPGELLSGAQVSITLDSGELLYKDLSTLAFSGLQTTLLVILILSIAIGWREALIAGCTIPLSLTIAFIAMRYSGNTLNFVSLFSLVLVIGIIVDASIVVVEGINTRIRNAASETMDATQKGLMAARQTVQEFHIPLTAGAMTTIAVFAPLFLVSGITGEFIKSIPFTVIAVLFSALLVSLGFIPLIGAKFAGRSIGEFGGRRGKIVEGARTWYRSYLENFLSNKRNASALLVSTILLLVFTISLPVFGALRVVFFETGNEDYLYIDIVLPQGSTLSLTDLETRKVEEVLYTVPEISSFTTSAGGSSQFGSTSGASSGEHLGNIFINLDENRSRRSSNIADDLRGLLADIGTSEIRVGELEGGPPTGRPITITFSGDSLADLDRTTEKASQLLESIPGTADVITSSQNSQLGFVIDFARGVAIEDGITSRTAAFELRSSLYGTTATILRNVDEDVDVRVMLDYNQSKNPSISNRTAPDVLLTTPVGNSGGTPSLLGSYAGISIEQSRASIAHDNGTRIVQVASSITSDANARVITAEFARRAETELSLPEGVTMKIGGENEDVDQSFTDLFVALILGVVGIFAILVLQFNSFRHAGYVLMSVPLSLVGVFGGLLIADRPISFPSIMGFIALAGIVVNNAIILIDTMNNMRRENPTLPIKDIVIESSVSRLRPVILTTITTVVGVIPLIFTAELWVPLAISLMFGLSFATILTLVLIPSVYNRWPGRLH